jgi:hypothetical protein
VSSFRVDNFLNVPSPPEGSIGVGYEQKCATSSPEEQERARNEYLKMMAISEAMRQTKRRF